MHHAAAQHFQPAGAAIGLLPGDVHFRARFNEREIAGAEAHLEIALEEGTHELGQRALQVGEGRMLVHQQAFDLVEHRRVGLVAVAAVHLAGGDHAQRRRVVTHVAHLYAGGMRAQQAAIAEVESVVHGARRMVRREVQRLEVVPVVLDLRPFRQLVAQPAEDAGDALQGAGDRVQASALAVAARQGDVDGFGRQARIQGRVFQQRLALAQRAGQRVAGLVDRFTGGLALVGWQGAELLELRGDAAALAKQGHAQLFQRIGALCGGHIGQRLGGEGLDVAHGGPELQSICHRDARRADPCRHRRPRAAAVAAPGPKKEWGRTCALPHALP